MNELRKIQKRAGSLIKTRERLEKENLIIEEMIAGSLIEHYKKCGKAVCRCTEGKLHGPYWYVSYKREGKAVLEYVAREDLTRTSRLARNYKKFQSNMTKIRTLNTQIIQLLERVRQIQLQAGKEK